MAKDPAKAKAATQRWREKNRARFLATKRAWRAKNRDAVRARRKAQYAANRTRELELAAAYKQENREAVAAQSARRLRADPAKNRLARSLRRAAEKRALAPWANKSHMLSFYELAPLVSEETGIPHEVGHIIPLQSKIVCGLHWEGNLQIEPVRENRSKSNRVWPDMPQTQGLIAHG